MAKDICLNCCEDPNVMPDLLTPSTKQLLDLLEHCHKALAHPKEVSPAMRWQILGAITFALTVSGRKTSPKGPEKRLIPRIGTVEVK